MASDGKDEIYVFRVRVAVLTGTGRIRAGELLRRVLAAGEEDALDAPDDVFDQDKDDINQSVFRVLD